MYHEVEGEGIGRPFWRRFGFSLAFDLTLLRCGELVARHMLNGPEMKATKETKTMLYAIAMYLDGTPCNSF